MARLIDAEPILMRWNTESLGRKEMYDMVKNAPMVDAVPVVRCKDCKWFGKMGCAIEVVEETDMPKENDFCSFAERKDDE